MLHTLADMARRSWPHNLAALMEQLDLSDRQLAEQVEARPEYRDSMRSRIVKYRGGTQMTEQTAQRFAAALTQLSGRPFTLDDLLDYTPSKSELTLIREQLTEMREGQLCELNWIQEQLAILHGWKELVEKLLASPESLKLLQELAVGLGAAAPRSTEAVEDHGASQ